MWEIAINQYSYPVNLNDYQQFQNFQGFFNLISPEIEIQQ